MGTQGPESKASCLMPFFLQRAWEGASKLCCFACSTLGPCLSRGSSSGGHPLGSWAPAQVYHPCLTSVLFFFSFLLLLVYYQGLQPPLQCSLGLSCAPSADEICPDHQTMFQCTLFLKEDSRFFHSSSTHLLGVAGSLPGEVARGRNIFFFSVLETGKIFVTFGILFYKGWD